MNHVFFFFFKFLSFTSTFVIPSAIYEPQLAIITISGHRSIGKRNDGKTIVTDTFHMRENPAATRSSPQTFEW